MAQRRRLPVPRFTSPVTLLQRRRGAALVGVIAAVASGLVSLAAPAAMAHPTIAPAVSTIAPNTGPVTGGTPIAITGSGFVDGDTVVIGQGQGPFTGALPATDVVVVDSADITAATPGGAVTGNWNLFVIDPDNNASTGVNDDLFTYTPAIPPAVTDLSVHTGPDSGGTPVQIFGSGFTDGDTVVIGQGQGPFTGALGVPIEDATFVNFGEIDITTPGGAVTGNWNLFVIDPDNNASTGVNDDLFTYTPAIPPAVTDLSVHTGPDSGGTPITITGTGFTASDTVVIGQGQGAFNGSLAATDVDVVDSTHITATAPGGAISGSWNLFVIDPDNKASSAVDGDLFTYIPPAVSDLSVHSGPVDGGTAVQVFGSGFVSDDVVVIGQGQGPHIGSLFVPGVTFLNSGEIDITTPGDALAGNWNLFVIDPDNNASTGVNDDLFTYTPAIPPAVTDLSVHTGPDSGGTPITITGTGFTASDTVVIGQGQGAFNGSLAATDVDVVDSTHITATAPGGAISGSWNLFVVDPDNNASAAVDGDLFTYTPAAPVFANDDAATVNKNLDAATTTGTTIDVLANDTAGSDPLTITAVTQPTHGTVTIAPDGQSVSYLPTQDYCNHSLDPNEPDSAADSFTYTANSTATATVNVTVDAVDQPPITRKVVRTRGPQVTTLTTFTDLTANTITNSQSSGPTTLDATDTTDPATCDASAVPLTYHWVVMYLSPNQLLANPYTDFGISGYRSATLTIASNSMIPSNSPNAGTHFQLTTSSAISGLSTLTDIQAYVVTTTLTIQIFQECQQGLSSCTDTAAEPAPVGTT
jgi:hypothetical protein